MAPIMFTFAGTSMNVTSALSTDVTQPVGRCSVPWPCPDCRQPFVPNHMCPKLREHLQEVESQKSWRWLARTLMLEANAVQQAFLVEQSLRVKEGSSG